jgi:hypothetical protein
LIKGLCVIEGFFFGVAYSTERLLLVVAIIVAIYNLLVTRGRAI